MNLFVKVFLFCIPTIIAANSYAQKTEIGLLLGGSYYYGDIVSTNRIQTQTIGPAGGVFLRKHLNKRTCFRANFMYARIGAADSNLVDKKSAFQESRNLAFYADLFELSGVVEYNLILDYNKARRIVNRAIPYVYGGLGLFYFEPKAIHPITGNPVNLRPLKLDGSTYSPIAIAFPIGAGVRYYLNRNWQLGFDIGIRLTTTSHLDDIAGDSRYANPATLPSEDAKIMLDRSVGGINSSGGTQRGKLDFITDIYAIGGVTLTYRLWPYGLGRAFRGAAISCPRFY
jgi:hypothetical protein